MLRVSETLDLTTARLDCPGWRCTTTGAVALANSAALAPAKTCWKISISRGASVLKGFCINKQRRDDSAKRVQMDARMPNLSSYQAVLLSQEAGCPISCDTMLAEWKVPYASPWWQC